LMSSRETTCRHMDVEKNTPRASTAGENELRRSQLSSVCQISMNQSTFYIIYMVVIGILRLLIWFTYL
jgi:hypothetical protein